MRRRSDALAGRSEETKVATPTSEPPKDVAGAYCSECGLPQRDPFGTGELGCANSHVGAGTVSAKEAKVIRDKDLGIVGSERSVEEVVKAREAAPPVGKASQKAEKLIEELHPGRIIEKVMAGDKGKALKEALSEAEKLAHNPTDWAGANRPEEAPVDPGFAAIVESIFVEHPEEAYARLEAAMKVGDGRTDYGSMMRHLDNAESNAREAHRLWQTAILERKRWELENEVVFAAAREEAVRTLQHEKAMGSRNKAITDADVESRVASMFPAELKKHELQRARVKAMVDSMQNLAEVWLSRCKTLQTLLSKQR